MPLTMAVQKCRHQFLPYQEALLLHFTLYFLHALKAETLFLRPVLVLTIKKCVQKLRQALNWWQSLPLLLHDGFEAPPEFC
jgi:hypothetical protein